MSSRSSKTELLPVPPPLLGLPEYNRWRLSCTLASLLLMRGAGEGLVTAGRCSAAPPDPQGTSVGAQSTWRGLCFPQSPTLQTGLGTGR